MKQLIELLKANNSFFNLFQYLKVRINHCKTQIIEDIKVSAKNKFVDRCMSANKV